jgi:hypothetical protein
MNKRLIKFYKGVVLEQLHTHLVKNGTMISIDELDVLLKSITGLDKSTTKMTTEELNELITDAFDLGDSVGIHLNYPDNEYKPVYDEEM